jgi:hypothetical protein
VCSSDLCPCGNDAPVGSTGGCANSAGTSARLGVSGLASFSSDTLRVVERYTPMGPNALRYEATLEDPNVFTGPWKMSMPLYRRLEEHAQVVEFKCVEFSEELLYGHLRKGATP